MEFVSASPRINSGLHWGGGGGGGPPGGGGGGGGGGGTPPLARSLAHDILIQFQDVKKALVNRFH